MSTAKITLDFEDTSFSRSTLCTIPLYLNDGKGYPGAKAIHSATRLKWRSCKNASLNATGRVTGMKWKKILQQGVFCNIRTTVDLRQMVHSLLSGYVFVQSNINSKLLLLRFYFCFNASNTEQNNKQDHLMSRARRCTREISSRNVASFRTIDGYKFCWKWLYLNEKVKERRQWMLNPCFL